jgi:hypothetical protein
VNTKKATRAAGAGLVATGMFMAALLVLGVAVFFGLDFSSNTGTGAGRIVVLVVVLVLGAAGGVLPARALGAGWWRSLLVSGIAVGALALAAPLLLATAEGLFVLFYLFALVAPAFVAIAASVGNGLSLAGLASVVAVAALFFLVLRSIGFFLLPVITETSAALVEGTAVVAAGWVLLPALVGLFQRRQDEAG